MATMDELPLRGTETNKPRVDLRKSVSPSESSEIRESGDNSLSKALFVINTQLKDSIFSTFKCSHCSTKLTAKSVKTPFGTKISFACKYKCGKPIVLTIDEVCAILNFNPFG